MHHVRISMLEVIEYAKSCGLRGNVGYVGVVGQIFS